MTPEATAFLRVSPHANLIGWRVAWVDVSEIETLAPGLYETKIDNPIGNPDCHKPEYSVRFEERHVEDLRFETPRAAFEQVRNLSEVNEQFYNTMISPFVRMAPPIPGRRPRSSGCTLCARAATCFRNPSVRGCTASPRSRV
ncbi:DUF3141 domain-containing protein [Roseiarcaceae bacterium H3SJ34-1]|uniref:DUF3141 domain-containing protein n=1 Tax=Terripilifer ovatus TaxID=3032367 RepID=UPI003AB9977F|nr:DUF3141 domain-containing protein [Roseiarcaceae bacterium H3SJ34-1]